MPRLCEVLVILLCAPVQTLYSARPLLSLSKPFSRVSTGTWPGRILALGDVHGDYNETLLLLRTAQIVDEKGHWRGGTSMLIQLGDLTDRGPQSRAVLRLFRRLRREARKAGGRCLMLMGNHEEMQLTGDFRYVHPEEKEEYGGGWKRTAAFQIDGYEGSFLDSFDVGLIVNKTLFIHGGLHPESIAPDVYGKENAIGRLNDDYRSFLYARLSRTGEVPMQLVQRFRGTHNPVWYRGNRVEERITREALRGIGAVRMVVGHTPQVDGRIKTKWGGRLVLADTALSRWMPYPQGRPTLLELLPSGELKELSLVKLDSDLVLVCRGLES